MMKTIKIGQFNRQVGAALLAAYRQASATEMARWIKKGEVEAEDLLACAIAVIEGTQGQLNNILFKRYEAAYKDLQVLKQQVKARGYLPDFYGVPILVKGLTHKVAGSPDCLGFSFMQDVIAQDDHELVQALKAAGFIIVGQTTFPEWGLLNVTHGKLSGVTRNPWCLAHSSGGSSGGSASAVAVGQVPIATSNDGGGSTRIPAAFSGLIGLHPTRGLLIGNSQAQYSHVSQFALMRDMTDTCQLFDYLLRPGNEGHLAEATRAKEKPIAYTLATPADTPLHAEASSAVLDAVDFLRALGYHLEEVPVYPIDGRAMIEAYYLIVAYEMRQIHDLARQYLGRDLVMGDIEDLTWALVQTGDVLSDKDVAYARATLEVMNQQLSAFYARYGFLLNATTAYPAPAADYISASLAQREQLRHIHTLRKHERLQLIYEQWLPAWTLTPYTQLANLTGTPALSLPTHLTVDGLPLGVMLSGPAYTDRCLLEFGKIFAASDKLLDLKAARNIGQC